MDSRIILYFRSMKIHILALGNSIKTYQLQSGITTIGVNNIYDYFRTNYLFCGDLIRRFPKERFLTIRTSTPRKFYSHLPCWEPFFGERMEKISYASVRGSMDEI